MTDPQEPKPELSKYEPAPVSTPEQEPKPVIVKKRQPFTCSVIAGSSALLATVMLFSIYNLCWWQCHNKEEKLIVLGKIQCNRANSSNQLYEALKVAPRSSWPAITTINRRQYVCISNYKVDVTDLGDR